MKSHLETALWVSSCTLDVLCVPEDETNYSVSKTIQWCSSGDLQTDQSHTVFPSFYFFGESIQFKLSSFLFANLVSFYPVMNL